MTGFFVRRQYASLVPDGIEDAAEFSSLPIGKPIFIEVKRVRSLPQHRYYWTLCRRIGNALGIEAENVSDVLKIETGHCDIVRSKKYGELRLPKSISFTKMTQDDFNHFMDNCIQVICTNWGMERKDVLAAVEDLLVPWEPR